MNSQAGMSWLAISVMDWLSNQSLVDEPTESVYDAEIDALFNGYQ